MSADNTERMLGQLDGKLDSLLDSFREYREAHDARHAILDEQVTQHAADINNAKGAKAALYVAAGVVSAFVSAAWAFAQQIVK